MIFTLYDASGPVEAIHEDTAVTVGVFDGVHRGHQQLLVQLAALHTPLSTLTVTLTAHPSFVLGRKDSEYWLDDPQEHLSLLFEAGAKYVAVLPFTPEVASMSACRMARLLHDRLRMRSLLLGYDSRFGSKQADDFDRLPQLADELGFTILHGKPFLVGDSPISSSRIRESLLQGAVEDTAALLGRPYSVCGTVQHGRGVGRTLGFPTANVDLTQTRKMLPKEGVYAVKVLLNQSAPAYTAIANLGTAPTFGVEQPLLEVHLLDFWGDLYGQPVTVQFIHRLRDIVRFSTAEALQAQLHQDLLTAQTITRNQ